MRALFLADAHLCKPDDPNYRTLLAFLEEQAGRTDLLVLLGDIFEFWIGKDKPTADYIPVIDAFERMRQQGTKLVYVEGNHDFHLGPVFTQKLDCKVLPDGGTIELDGKKVYLAHGDLANPSDINYRRLRNLLRGRMVRFLIRTLPVAFVQRIATSSSNKSRRSSGNKRHQWTARNILQPYAEALIASGHQAVITGHYHNPFQLELEGGELIALGDWIDQYSYALYEDQSFKLLRYSVATATEDSTS